MEDPPSSPNSSSTKNEESAYQHVAIPYKEMTMIKDEEYEAPSPNTSLNSSDGDLAADAEIENLFTPTTRKSEFNLLLQEQLELEALQELQQCPRNFGQPRPPSIVTAYSSSDEETVHFDKLVDRPNRLFNDSVQQTGNDVPIQLMDEPASALISLFTAYSNDKKFLLGLDQYVARQLIELSKPEPKKKVPPPPPKKPEEMNDQEMIQNIMDSLLDDIVDLVGPYPITYLNVGHIFESQEEILKLLDKWEQNHEYSYKVEPETRCFGEKWDKFEAKYVCEHGGEPKIGYEEVPKCPSHFIVRNIDDAIKKNKPRWIVTSVCHKHQWHKIDGVIPGFDYSNITIRPLMVDRYSNIREGMAIQAHTVREPFMYCRVTDTWVSTEALRDRDPDVVAQPPLRNPKEIFPRWNPFYHSTTQPNGSFMLPGEMLPIGFWDNHDRLEEHEKWRRKQEQICHQLKLLDTLTPAEQGLFIVLQEHTLKGELPGGPWQDPDDQTHSCLERIWEEHLAEKRNHKKYKDDHIYYVLLGKIRQIERSKPPPVDPFTRPVNHKPDEYHPQKRVWQESRQTPEPRGDCWNVRRPQMGTAGSSPPNNKKKSSA